MRRHAHEQMNAPAPSAPAAAPPPPAPAQANSLFASSTFLAWSFVLVWGTGYLASKAGLQHVAPFTFLTLRFSFGLLVLLPLLLLAARRDPLRWPTDARTWGHVIVAGLLMHAANLGGSHYAQYLGMSAGVTALVLATQPLATAFIAAAFMHERLRPFQWVGVLLGLIGVAFVVWHKIDVRAIHADAVAAVLISLTAITAGTLYQRVFCPTVDLRTSTFIQFAASLMLLVPLAGAVEGFEANLVPVVFGAIAFLVFFGSIFATNVLHTLMRRGEATRVTSLLYLTPIVAVLLEWLLFGVVPSLLTVIGIAVTCAGVALVAWQPRRQADA
jgi:drug/metabolite transporter (DMT)-like permease